MTATATGERYDDLVVIGRFDPPHHGHLALLKRALALGERVIVVLGSAHRLRSVRHPFTVQERQQMVLACLSAAERARVQFVPVRDYYNDSKWVAAVQAGVRAALAQSRAGATEAPRIGVLASDQGTAQDYVRQFPQWATVRVEHQAGQPLAELGQLLFAPEHQAGNWMLLETAVPAPVFEFLRAFRELPLFQDLLAEQAWVLQYRASWASAPFPPVFVTVDVVLYCLGHVLMIRRAGFPHKGSWALPGGFLDGRERIARAALRELREETGLDLLDSYLEGFLKDKEVFDHPDRSLRGRTITHAYFYDLSLAQLPKVRGDDDASEARWIPLAEIPDLESSIMEDHLEIIDRFLHIL